MLAAAHVYSSPAPYAALKSGRIRGAGLDVFETEPLPADNELWVLPNVFISAHTADRTKVWTCDVLPTVVVVLRRITGAWESFK